MAVRTVSGGRRAAPAASAAPTPPAPAPTAVRGSTRTPALPPQGAPTLAGPHSLPVGTRTAPLVPTRFEVKDRHKVDVPEPSGMASLGPGKGFVLVSDSARKLYLVTPGKHGVKTKALEPDGGRKHLDDLEDVAFDPRRNALLLLSEGRSRVVEVPFDNGKPGKARPLADLPEIGRIRNRGWEGLCMLEARLTADGRDRLLAVHEGTPRRLAILDPQSLEVEIQFKLPAATKDAAHDLSAITVDPATGRLFALSDESNALVELQLNSTHKPGAGGRPTVKWSLEHVGSSPLPMPKHGRLHAEGLAFDGAGDLWVLAEHKHTLLHLARQN